MNHSIIISLIAALALIFPSAAPAGNSKKETWQLSSVVTQTFQKGQLVRLEVSGTTSEGSSFTGIGELRPNRTKLIDADSIATKGFVRFMVQVELPEVGLVPLCGKARFTGSLTKDVNRYVGQGELSVITVQI